ncbi:hypothetical protein D6817_05805, partial [Candidatus Pacearchaeota archaeon]
ARALALGGARCRELAPERALGAARRKKFAAGKIAWLVKEINVRASMPRLLVEMYIHSYIRKNASLAKLF